VTACPIVFDLDGTLVDSLPGIAAAANALLADEGLPPLPQARIGAFVGHGERVFLDRLIAASDLDPSDDARLMARFLDLYVSHSRGTVLFPHVAEVLGVFREQGVRRGLCTNKPSAPLAAVLETTGLGEVFDAIVAGDTLPVRKPDPAPLRHALALLGSEAGVYVGDSPVDAETARRADMPFVLFTEGIRDVPVESIGHDARYSDFRDLPAIYGDLTASGRRRRV
jgi:phosphoglycolate phosphatase